ncbi:MAG: trypsin-like serine protease [Verrucomicrobiales bacterium]
MPGSFRPAASFLPATLVLWFFMSTSPVPAIGMRQDVPESVYIDLANNAAAYPHGKFPDFMPVAAIGIKGSNGKFEVMGSGTLVAPDWVLTAAHVALSSKRGQDFETNLEVRFGPSGSAPISRHPVSEVATPLSPASLRPLLRSGPRYTESQVVHAEFNDLALLHLATPVAGIAPASIDDSGEALLGRIIYIAGFGDATTGNNTRSRTWTQADLKRAAENIIDREILRNPYDVSTVGGILLFDFDNGEDDRNTLNLRSKSWDHLFGVGQSSPTPTQIEGASYPGDSGGPAFARVGGKWALVAVSGYGTGFPPDRRRTSIQFGDILAYTRVSPHAAWIRQTTSVSKNTPPAAIVSRAAPAEVISESSPTPKPVAGMPEPPIFRSTSETAPQN